MPIAAGDSVGLSVGVETSGRVIVDLRGHVSGDMRRARLTRSSVIRGDRGGCGEDESGLRRTRLT